jgi:hypothetical protein
MNNTDSESVGHLYTGFKQVSDRGIIIYRVLVPQQNSSIEMATVSSLSYGKCTFICTLYSFAFYKCHTYLEITDIIIFCKRNCYKSAVEPDCTGCFIITMYFHRSYIPIYLCNLFTVPLPYVHFCILDIKEQTIL